jgi:hypothetical protein
MVKLADVMFAPADVVVVAPVEDVDAAGVGIPELAFVVVPLTLVVAAGTGVGPPVLEIWDDEPFVFVVAAAVGAGVTVTDGVPFTTVVAAALLAVVLQAPGVVKVGVPALYVGAPATPLVTTTVLL